MHTIAYIRVSTPGQAAEGISLEAQRAKIEAYCQLHDLDLTLIESDEGISAKNVAGRPGLIRLLDLVKTKKVDAVVVYSLSRLARSTRDALDLADLFNRKGVALHSISEKLDTTSAIGSFFFVLTSSLAELERRQVGERTSMALQHRRSQGFKTGGSVPYGYRAKESADGTMLEPIKAEQRIIDRIIAWRAEGLSLARIAQRLDKAGIEAKQGKWHPEKVRRVLRSHHTSTEV